MTHDSGSDDYKEAQRARRAKRLPIRTEEILALRSEGFRVEQKTEWHLRIYGVRYGRPCEVDVWPIHNRFHLIRENKRGGAKNLADFVRAYFAGRSYPHMSFGTGSGW